VLYSKFGSRLTPVSKSQDANGRVIVQAKAEDTPDLREYPITDLKADDGSAEINEIISKLPLKVVEKKPVIRRNPDPPPQNNRMEPRSQFRHRR
jgi:hypothetical protein